MNDFVFDFFLTIFFLRRRFIRTKGLDEARDVQSVLAIENSGESLFVIADKGCRRISKVLGLLKFVIKSPRVLDNNVEKSKQQG